MIEKHILVLDLDEALVYSTEIPNDESYNFQIYQYYVWKRPYVDEFIRTISDWFELAVWTSATKDYANDLTRILFPNPSQLKFVWSRERCTLRNDLENRDYYWTKDLKKVKKAGYCLEKVLVLEDDYRTMERSYGNLILVKPFYGDSGDVELNIVLPFLNWIKDTKNVRNVEKRFWRNGRK